MPDAAEPILAQAKMVLAPGSILMRMPSLWSAIHFAQYRMLAKTFLKKRRKKRCSRHMPDRQCLLLAGPAALQVSRWAGITWHCVITGQAAWRFWVWMTAYRPFHRGPPQMICSSGARRQHIKRSVAACALSPAGAAPLRLSTSI